MRNVKLKKKKSNSKGENLWETIVDFTKIKAGGIPIKILISRI